MRLYVVCFHVSASTLNAVQDVLEHFDAWCLVFDESCYFVATDADETEIKDDLVDVSGPTDEFFIAEIGDSFSSHLNPRTAKWLDDTYFKLGQG